MIPMDIQQFVIRCAFIARESEVEHVTMSTDEHGDTWATNGAEFAEVITPEDVPHAWELDYITSAEPFGHPSRT